MNDDPVRRSGHVAHPGLTAVVAVAAAIVLGTTTAWALTAKQEAKLTASDAADVDLFGWSVALSGDTAVVGAPNDEHEGGIIGGSAYVFVRSGTGWTEQAKLTASDAATVDDFGRSVALSGDTAVIGAFTDDDNGSGSGSAYVFVRSGSGWTGQAKLTASDAATNGLFGTSVALSDDTAVVGAQTDDHAGVTSPGSAYVFVRSGTGWTEQAKLTASDPSAFAQFGHSVALSGDTAVVGAHRDGSFSDGSAYVFVRSGTVWSEQAKLTASDAADGDWFGFGVALAGDTALVGAKLEGDNDDGSAYVFVRSGASWSQQAKLINSEPAIFDNFGNSVALSGDTAVVGAWTDDHAGGLQAGSAYVFLRSGTSWNAQAKLIASDAAESDRFGGSVAISGDTAVVGAHQNSHAGGHLAGSAYVFRLFGDAGDVPAVKGIGTVFLLLAMLGTGVYFVRRRVTS